MERFYLKDMETMETGQEEGNVFLSVVIPSFNEGTQIRFFLETVKNYLDTREFQYEILVVDDASTDETWEIINKLDKIYPFIFLKNEINRGKGYSIKKGILASHGNYILLLDADNAYRISSLDDFLGPLRKNECDIALGNRRMPQSRFVLRPKYLPYIYIRHLTGVIFNWIVRMLVLPEFTDTQCGYKCFKRKAAQNIFKRQLIQGFCFDVEILCLAVKLGYRCLDVPVTFYYCGEPSSIRFFHTLHFLRDLFLIRKNLFLGIYHV